MNDLFSNSDIKLAAGVVIVAILSFAAAGFVYLKLSLEARGQTLALNAKTDVEAKQTKADSDQNDERTRRYVLDMANQSNKRIDDLTAEIDKLRELIRTLENEKSFDAGRYSQVAKELADTKQENTRLHDELSRLEFGQKASLDEIDRLRSKIDSQAQRITDLEALNRAVQQAVSATQNASNVDLPTNQTLN